MKLELLEKQGLDMDREGVVCPKNGETVLIPGCRRGCVYFKGYKTENNQRKLLCDYSEEK